MTRIAFSSWSPSDRSFRNDLYVYNVQDSDGLAAARKADEYGGDYILVFEIGNGNLLITYRLENFSLTPQGFFGENYSILKSSVEEFLESLEDYRIIEDMSQYSLRRRGEEEVDVI